MLSVATSILWGGTRLMFVLLSIGYTATFVLSISPFPEKRLSQHYVHLCLRLHECLLVGVRSSNKLKHASTCCTHEFIQAFAVYINVIWDSYSSSSSLVEKDGLIRIGTQVINKRVVALGLARGGSLRIEYKHWYTYIHYIYKWNYKSNLTIIP